MLIVIESGKSLADVCAAMEPSVQKHKFGVLGVHNLKETMAKKGVAFARECFIYEVCNPVQAKRVLESKMEVSTALPCRISVFTEHGTTKIGLIRPVDMLSALSQDTALAQVAKEVEEKTIQMVDEAK